MQNDWAAENLHVIRTLMERSALYRRALAPILLYLGVLGTIAGLAGHLLHVNDAIAFVCYWDVIGLAGLAGCFLLARRQAIKDAEPFWSPPTRRVAQALLPPLVAGGVVGVLVAMWPGWVHLVVLPAIWMVFYGCALTSAGFFMRRGMRLLGWAFLIGGCILLTLAGVLKGAASLQVTYSHLIMGGSFGMMHLVCGLYLRKDNANAL